MSLRLERVRELLKREIGEAIRKELPVEEVGLINVNDVDVAPNLHNATVYIGVFGDAAKKKRAMEALTESRKTPPIHRRPSRHSQIHAPIALRARRIHRARQSRAPHPGRVGKTGFVRIMKAHPKIIDRILEAIAASQRICVAGHVRPDGDCIGSQIGLTMALRAQGKDVSCWNEDPMPQKYAFLDRNRILRQPEAGHEFDLVIAADCASFERLGVVGAAIAQRRCLINIDHHESNTRYGDVNWISESEASTGELIFQLLQAADWAITPAIADNLFTAVSTDTGSFQYPTTKPGTYQTAGELVRLGAHLDTICNEVYQSFSLSRVRLLKHLYNHFHLTHKDKIAYLWLKKKRLRPHRRRTQRHRGPHRPHPLHRARRRRLRLRGSRA